MKLLCDLKEDEKLAVPRETIGGCFSFVPRETI
jgi:hypothetical protein